MAWNDLLALIGFFVLCTLAASSGAIFKPGAWYDGLRKPSWVPPKWAFPVVWTILFIMMAVAGVQPRQPVFRLSIPGRGRERCTVCRAVGR